MQQFTILIIIKKWRDAECSMKDIDFKARTLLKLNRIVRVGRL